MYKFSTVLIDDNISLVPDTQEKPEHVKNLETYARRASLLFCPFRNISNLQTDGKFLLDFQEFVKNGKLKIEHQNVLRNIQDTYNSLNAGRPIDPLERVTQGPYGSKYEDEFQDEKEQQQIEEMDFLSNEVLGIDDEMCFRTKKNTFAMDTSIVTKLGTNLCGHNLLQLPTVDKSSTIFSQRTTHPHGPTNSNHTTLPKSKTPSFKTLYEIITRRKEVVTTDKN